MAFPASGCSRSISPIRWRAPTIPNPSRTNPRPRTTAASLREAVAALKQRTGAAKVALVANSRGGNSVRNFIKNGGAADVSHAVLCGVPNHGVYDWDQGLSNEFNGRGPFLRGLNEGDSEVTPGVAFLTLRSDGMDKFAQADGRFVGKPGTPTGITSEGPALKGATNLVIGGVDHRETAYSPRAFAEMFKFIAGRAPQSDRGRAGDRSQIERARHRHARRHPDQPSGRGRVGRSLSRVSRYRRAHRRPGSRLEDRRGWPLGAGAGRSRLASRNRAGGIRARPPRISTARRFRARPTSCICVPRARSDRRTPAPARSC